MINFDIFETLIIPKRLTNPYKFRIIMKSKITQNFIYEKLITQITHT
jgi:hypothetical protein